METEPQRGEKRIDLTGLEDCIQAARHQSEALVAAIRSLPKVDEEGGSECPFAEELYAKKEELQQKVEGLFKQLHEYKAAVKLLIESCKRDLVVVSAHEDQLNGDRARAKFSEAEAALAGQYKHYLKLRDRIRETIKIVDKALREAVTKRYPGKIPERWPGADFSSPSPYQNQSPASELSGADKELRDLFELDRQDRAAS